MPSLPRSRWRDFNPSWQPPDEAALAYFARIGRAHEYAATSAQGRKALRIHSDELSNGPRSGDSRADPVGISNSDPPHRGDQSRIVKARLIDSTVRLRQVKGHRDLASHNVQRLWIRETPNEPLVCLLRRIRRVAHSSLELSPAVVRGHEAPLRREVPAQADQPLPLGTPGQIH